MLPPFPFLHHPATPPHSFTSLPCPQGHLATVDPLLPDLLAFPPGTDLHDHPLVASGALVLQVGARCMACCKQCRSVIHLAGP